MKTHPELFADYANIEDAISRAHTDTLSAFTAKLELSGAAARLTITATTASRTSRFVSEYDHSARDMLSQSFPLPVAN